MVLPNNKRTVMEYFLSLSNSFCSLFHIIKEAFSESIFWYKVSAIKHLILEF